MASASQTAIFSRRRVSVSIVAGRRVPAAGVVVGLVYERFVASRNPETGHAAAGFGRPGSSFEQNVT
ncbi:hypothetical protein Dda_8419 [Drechslerella dactyloides]|uniref:Uncharacterized protein n=1 Tax=Drechslerella dactyloides TaxID=74499 RepID=A0AAD6NEU2_DREDA|nr:hypothetical protein Dda_8419 [Drechslerella dactyloides]